MNLCQVHSQEVGMMHSSRCFVLAFKNHQDACSTSHTTLEAYERCILKGLIARKHEDNASSLDNGLKVKA